jgi:hypothetical protein
MEDNTRKLINVRELELMNFSTFEKLVSESGVIDQASYSLIQMLDQRKMLRDFIIKHMKDSGVLKKILGKKVLNAD